MAGSDDLERWARSAAEAVAGAYRDRVLAPLLQLKDELFATFRQRRSIVSVGEYETDKASLERMLRDFESDFGRSSTVGDSFTYFAACTMLLHFTLSYRHYLFQKLERVIFKLFSMIIAVGFHPGVQSQGMSRNALVCSFLLQCEQEACMVSLPGSGMSSCLTAEVGPCGLS